MNTGRMSWGLGIFAVQIFVLRAGSLGEGKGFFNHNLT